MILRLKCDPLGAPLPVVAFCAAAVVAASAAATAAARCNLKRMRPPSSRCPDPEKHQAPSATSRAPRGLLEPACLGSAPLWTRCHDVRGDAAHSGCGRRLTRAAGHLPHAHVEPQRQGGQLLQPSHALLYGEVVPLERVVDGEPGGADAILDARPGAERVVE